LGDFDGVCEERVEEFGSMDDILKK